jgi:hypothetical protein
VLITILTVFLVVFGLAALVLGWLTYRASRNRRELLYSMSPAISLLGTALRPAHPSLQVLYDGRLLAHPRVIWVRLRARGRNDIRSEDFDQGRPLVLDFHTKIIAVLSVDNGSASGSALKRHVEGTRLEIGPDMIRMGVTLAIAVLVDGPQAELTYESNLANVRLCREDYQYPADEVAAATRIALGFRERPLWQRHRALGPPSR